MEAGGQGEPMDDGLRNKKAAGRRLLACLAAHMLRRFVPTITTGRSQCVLHKLWGEKEEEGVSSLRCYFSANNLCLLDFFETPSLLGVAS